MTAGVARSLSSSSVTLLRAASAQLHAATAAARVDATTTTTMIAVGPAAAAAAARRMLSSRASAVAAGGTCASGSTTTRFAVAHRDGLRGRLNDNSTGTNGRGFGSSSRARQAWVSAGGRGGWNGGTLGGAKKKTNKPPKTSNPPKKKAPPPEGPRGGSRPGPGQGAAAAEARPTAAAAAAAAATETAAAAAKTPGGGEESAAEDGEGGGDGRAVGAVQTQVRNPQKYRTGILERVPNVSPADDILNSGLKRAGRITPTKGLRDPVLKERNRSAKQLDALTTALCKPLGEYVKGFPRLERLHPFERALLELTLEDGVYESTLYQVDAVRKGMLNIGKGLTARAAKAKGPKEAVNIREEGFEEMEKYFLRGKASVDELKEIAKTLRRLPVAELQTPTVAFVGAPNVGKSSLVRVLSSGTPEVCNYPFTTRGIKMGHFFIHDKRHVVTDTPGLLWRQDEERNKIEKLAIATLEHLPTCVVFVTDLSGLCGTTVADQLAIRADLHERFAHRRPWLDVLSKSKLVPALGGDLSPDLRGTWGESDEREAIATAETLLGEGALAVSAEEALNVETLLARVTDVLLRHKETLEVGDAFGNFDPLGSAD